MPQPDARASLPRRPPEAVADATAATPPILAVLESALSELEARRAKLAPLLAEADQLERAIEEQRKAVDRVRGHAAVGPREARRPAWVPSDDSEAGRALAALRSHPRGLALPVLARVCDLPDATLKGIMPRLVQSGLAVRPAKGFYKATLEDSARDTEAMGGRDELEARRVARA